MLDLRNTEKNIFRLFISTKTLNIFWSKNYQKNKKYMHLATGCSGKVVFFHNLTQFECTATPIG